MTRYLPNNLMLISNKLKIIFPDLLVIACCLVSIGLTIINSRLIDDAHHMGLMYGNATDLNQGLVPYREIFIQYGILTTLIQSFSLNIFGDRVVSVVIITGIFYAINIYLSYCLWQKILNKWLSSISSVLMFLVQASIYFPWANYFSYTFLLVSLLFITSSPQKKYKYLLAGVFAGLSLLARQSLLPILAPFYLYFLFIFYVSPKKEFWQLHFKNIVLFHVGLISVWGVFWVYLIQQSAFRDWQVQSFKILNAYSSLPSFSAKAILLNFLPSLILGKGDSKKLILYSLIFFNTLVIFLKLLLTAIKNKPITDKQKTLFLFGSVILLGYLNALHKYELYRLQNASSLGFGLLVLSVYSLSTRFRKWKILFATVLLVVVSILVIHKNQTLVFTDNFSVFNPLSNNLKELENIEIFKGKLYDDKTRNYYQNL